MTTIDPRVQTDENTLLDEPRGGSGFSVHEDEFIAGIPSEDAEQIVEQCRATGCQNFLSILGSGPGMTRDDTVSLFGEEVVPALRSAEIT